MSGSHWPECAKNRPTGASHWVPKAHRRGDEVLHHRRDPASRCTIVMRRANSVTRTCAIFTRLAVSDATGRRTVTCHWTRDLCRLDARCAIFTRRGIWTSRGERQTTCTARGPASARVRATLPLARRCPGDVRGRRRRGCWGVTRVKREIYIGAGDRSHSSLQHWGQVRSERDPRLVGSEHARRGRALVRDTIKKEAPAV